MIYITDIYHRPGDPDDHIDLLTLLALPEFDIKAVLLDVRPPRPHAATPYEPGVVTLAQISYLTGRSFPVAVGPKQPLRSPNDTLADQSPQEQSAIALLLSALRTSSEPVVINTVGTARIITAAYNQDPALLRAKTRAIVLNAGSSGGGPLEHNVKVDVASYVGLLRSGLPIRWYPCAGNTTDWKSPEAAGERNTFWTASHAELFDGVPYSVKAWFTFAMTGSARGDILRALEEQDPAEVGRQTTTGQRNLWSTASLVMAAGRELARTRQGWRFVPLGSRLVSTERVPFSLDPVRLDVSDNGEVTVTRAAKSNILLFRRPAAQTHRAAMAEALNALIRSISTRYPAGYVSERTGNNTGKGSHTN